MRTPVLFVALFVALAACKGNSPTASPQASGQQPPPEEQSFADAMKVICEATDPSPAYFREHLHNAEAERLFASLGTANPADARRLLDEALARAGRTSCPSVTTLSKPKVDAPKVADLGLVELTGESSTLAITASGIVVDGQAIVAVADGNVDPTEKEGGAQGVMIPKLREFMKATLANQAKRPAASQEPVLAVIATPTTSYRLLIDTLFSTKSAGVRRFLLAVDAGGTAKAIPIVLPDAKPVSRGVGMVVAMARSGIRVWSLSGQEGTLKKPKLEVPIDRVADVQKALAEIVARRWRGSKRADADREILVMTDAGATLQVLASLLVAVRTNTDGSELFPELRLGSGFE